MTARLRSARLIVVLASAAVLLLGVAVPLWMNSQQTRAEQARDALVLDIARRTAVDLLSVTDAAPGASMDRLVSGAAGEFKQDLVSRSDAYHRAITEAKVSSQGSVSEAGIRAVTDDAATVLVSATSRVSNSRAPDGEHRSYRMVVELTRQDGSWLVSKLDFAP